MTPRSFFAGLRALFRRLADEQEIAREVQSYLDTAVEARVASGMPRDEAVRRVRLELGNPRLVREDVRAAGWEHSVETLLLDARFAVRLIRRAPGFSLAVVLILALGIGGNTAIFSLLNTIYFRTLPIPRVDRVLRLLDSNTGADGQQRMSSMHSQNVVQVRDAHAIFASSVAMFGEDLTLTGASTSERVTVVFRTDGWRETLGVAPAAGRDFTADEEHRGREGGVALMSFALWQREFGGATLSSVALHLDGRPFSVVGVMPPGFRFPYEADVWVPVVVDPSDRARDYAVFGRLREGVTVEQARSALAVMSASIRRSSPDALAYAIGVRTLRDNLVDTQAATTFALLLVVGFLLLLACVNVATLVMARSIARQNEFVVRAVLGASRGRQFGQMLVETLVLAAGGGVAGVGLALWASGFTAALIPANISSQLGVASAELDLRVLLVAAAVTLLVAIVVGVIPALSNVRDAGAALRDAGRGTQGHSVASRRLLNAFVAGQTALALVLLCGAGFMWQDLLRLAHRDLGFDTHQLLTMVMTPSVAKYPRTAARARLVDSVERDIASLPGVVSVGSTTVNPLSGTQWGTSVFIEGRGTGAGDAFNVNHRLVTRRVFAAMGIPVVRGRSFTIGDDASHPGVAIVSDAMARRFWPGGDAVGKRVRVARQGASWLTIVGVAGNVHDARDAGDPVETWYLPYAQNAVSRAADDVHLMIRVAGDPESIANASRDAVRRIDRDLAIYDVASMDREYADTFARQRLGTAVTASFGAFGLILAAIGIYGVMAFAVAQRTSEIGLRMALGADRSRIVRIVLARGIRLSLVGLLLGGLAAVIVNRLFASVLPDLRAIEPIVLLGAAAVLFLSAAIAAYIPARRAAALDPLVALRAGP